MLCQFWTLTRGLASARPFRSLAASLALLAGLVGPSLAAEPRYSPRAGVSDSMLARTALAALDADSQLRDVNIVVSVVDRQAVIGGVVTTPELARRAETIVRNATGIAVKNRCFVQSQPDPLIRAVADRLDPLASRRPATHDLPGMVRPPRLRSVDEAYAPPTTAVASAPSAVSPPVTTLKIPSQTPSMPSLLQDPVPSPNGPRYATQPPVPTVSPVPARLTTTAYGAMPPVTVPTRPNDLTGTLTDLRRLETRFAGLTLAVRDGSVYLGGISPRASDVWDFAERVRRVPGVRQVFVGPVSTR